MDISVIIPVYNSRLTIITCIDSVVSECCTSSMEWEIILVDDGSKDDSADIISKYIASSHYHNRIRLIRQPNGGAAKARNTGLKVAKGRFIAFNDSDDKWLRGRVAFQTKYFADHTETELLGGIYGEEAHGISLKKLGYDTRIDIKAQIMKNYFSPPTVMFRASILSKIGYFDEKLRHAEDTCFFNVAAVHCHCVYVRESFATSILGKAHWGESGLSGNLVAMERGELFGITSAYHRGFITWRRFAFAYAYSVAKFFRRWAISKTRKVISRKNNL